MILIIDIKPPGKTHMFNRLHMDQMKAVLDCTFTQKPPVSV